MASVVWKTQTGSGLEYCEIEQDPVTLLTGTVITFLHTKPFSVSYRVICDAYGSTRTVHVSSQYDGFKNQFSLNRSSDDHWFRDGEELPEFTGLLDIDLSMTPSTNTLPIRRLQLDVGESKEITAVWVRFPECKLAPLSQRYTRLDASTYFYESINSGYKAKLTVDEEGIVVQYESQWERVES